MRQIPTAFLFAAVVADSSGALAVAAASDISFFKQPVTLGEGPSQCANLLSSPWSADQSWIGSAEIDDADNGDEMSRDFLFMHIPKTAGTSFGGKRGECPPCENELAVPSNWMDEAVLLVN